MTAFRRAFIALAILTAGFPALPAAAEGPVAACDRLAAHPLDPERPAGYPGVPFDALDPAPAITACKRALAAEPDNPRLHFELGRALLRAERHAEAATALRRSAEAGYAAGQVGLGMAYGHGWGVPQDFAEAERLYRRAAVQGHVKALYNLGVIHATGRGVGPDRDAAIAWFRRAAAQGDAEAGRRADALAAEAPAAPGIGRLAAIALPLLLAAVLLVRWRRRTPAHP